MTDIMTAEERSRTMSLIRSKWTVPEKRTHNFLKGLKIRHNMHPKMFGNPDIILKDSKTVIFIDGCFWHGCRKCSSKTPSTNVKFWSTKIKTNVLRDLRTRKTLKRKGYKVVRLWEHDIKKNFDNSIKKIVG